MIKNTQGITQIEFRKTAHCFCPLGNDWFTCEVWVTLDMGEQLIDFCHIDTFFAENIEGQKLIVEDVVKLVADFVERYGIKGYYISAETEDAVHLPVKAIKIKE